MLESADNVTGRANAVSEVFRPTSVEHVVDLVRSARQSKTGLYVVSRGLNWGYGSKSPVTPGCALVDLSDMNRILNEDEISVSRPVAVIQAGVTQGQLHEFLQRRCPRLTFNVTGSGRDTSLLGNALDRGVGYLGPRRDDVFGMEVVCGTGEVLRTGFRRLGEASPLAHSHPYGLGPMLDGLFFQGNFGIVTSACFRLVPRPRVQVALSLSLRTPGAFPEFVDGLMQLKREGVVPTVTHVGDQPRTRATLTRGVTDYLEAECGLHGDALAKETDQVLALVSPAEWTSLTALSGEKDQVDATVRTVRRRLGAIARVRVISDVKLDRGYAVCHALKFLPVGRRNAAALRAIRPLHALATGTPSNVAIDNLLWMFGQPELKAADLDRSRCGILYICPALPPEGRVVAETIAGMRQVATSFGHTLYLTVNVETSNSIVAVANLLFDRGVAAETEKAHQCADALLRYIHAQRLEVYRARADMMASVVEADPAYWDIVRSLKNALDPDNVISPGRYNLAA